MAVDATIDVQVNVPEVVLLLADAKERLAALESQLTEAHEAMVRHQTEPDPDDPDGWIRRSALNHWCQRATAAESALAEAREAMDRLAAHDIAADKREGLEHCVELQHVHDVLARLRKVATLPQRP